MVTGLSIPRSPDEVTPGWLTRALGGHPAFGGAVVTGCTAEAIAEGTGFMGRLSRLRLQFKRAVPGAPETVILKLPGDDPQARAFSDRLRQHQREALFFREGIAVGAVATPEAYHCALDPATGETALLLEDLRTARQGDSLTGCTLEEARLAIAQIARFHAAWWDSPRLAVLSWLPAKDAEVEAYDERYAEGWRALTEQAGAGMPSGLRRIGDGLAPRLGALKARLSASPRTVIHGDFRLDNCFFSTGADGRETSVTVFDWEFCAQARGAYDIAVFISEAFAPSQRRRVERGLLRGYRQALLQHGVTGYGVAALWEDYRLSLLEELVFWVVTAVCCDYRGERASAYLRAMLTRMDAAIGDLRPLELLAG